MTNLPSFRPRQLIGRLAQNGEVFPDIGFLRWLDLVLNRSNELQVSSADVGDLKPSIRSTVPDGWLVCDGSAVSKTTYAGLYAEIGGAFGESGTAFNLPDLRNRGLVGADTIAFRATGGSNSTTLVEANLPAHTHGVTDSGHTHGLTDSGHTHGVTDPGHTHIDRTLNNAGITVDVGVAEQVPEFATGASGGNTNSVTTGITVDSATTGVSVGNATTGISIGSTGSGTAIDTTPASMGVRWLIKT